MDSDKDKSIDGSDESDSEIIRKCELELSQIDDRRITRESEMEHANAGFTTRKPEVRSEKRKACEEDTNSEDGYVTVEKRRPKRLLRSISTGQGQNTTSKEIGSKNEVCVTSFKELPKQMALAKLLRSENILNIETIKYKSPFKVLICFQSNNDAEKLISCKKFQALEYKCQKTFETTVSYGLIRGVDLEFTEQDILAILKSDTKILAVRRLKRLDLNSKWVESETVRICFQGTVLPLYVTAYEYKFKVENYTFPVTQCTGCWKFGHIIKVCPTKKILCPKCGSTEHINCDLKTYKCLNCKGLHFVLDKRCPTYLKEKEIRITMSKENIPYRKALQMIINKNQIEMSNNLNIHSKDTFVNQEMTEQPTQVLENRGARSYSQSILMEWGIIKEKIHCFVRNSGSNTKRAMKLGDIPDVSCTVHQLQLCVRTLLDCDEEIKALLSKCKKISTNFNHSQIAQTELQKIQKEQLNQECLSVIQECSTRWDSTFYMLERMIRIQDSLCLYACKHNISQLSPEEWLQLKKK
ncbi:unnamed protein product [Parnassius apollo]|uniref:(apollo) hypothetical protein n=1 Tax=Parnassius apollo TaxID=110799 RepID=A0A8S3WUS5_PARAO|nr:unnamed protein product [Parnassius apollo]